MANTGNIGSVAINVNYSVNQGTYKSVNNSISRLQAKAPKIQSAFTSAFGKIGVAITAAFSIAAIKKFSSACTSAYKVQFTAEAKLETVMRQRMNATNAEIQAVKDLASEYQKLGVIGDEVALTGIAQLATFAKSSKSLETLLPNFENALVGMYGMDVTTSQATQLANQLGKALANGSLSALTKSGMTFTAAEQSAFELANELERAEILSQALVNNYGEMNKVVGNTPLGRIKQLSNAWGDVLEKFGNAFSNIAAIFVPALMKIVSWLDGVASMLAKVSEAIARIFGTSYIKNEKAALSDTAGGLSDVADGYEDVGTAAKKASESLAKFDNVVQLSDSSSSGSGSGSGLGSEVVSVGEVIEEEKADGAVDSLISKIKSIPDAFKKAMGSLGLSDRIARLFDFSEIKKNAESIGQSVTEILENITPSAFKFMKSYAKSIITASVVVFEVAKSITESLTGGISLWLEQGKERISEQWSEILINFSESFDSISALTSDLSYLLSGFFSLESTKQALSNAMTALEGIVSGTYLVVSDLFSYITQFVQKTIDDNYFSLEDFFSNVSSLIEKITGTISSILTDSFQTIHNVFDKYIRPTFEQFQEGFSRAFGAVVDTWNSAVLPMLQIVATTFDTLWKNHLKPFVDEVLGMVGAFIECVATIYNKVISPIVSIVVEKFLPPIMQTLSVLWGAVEGLVQNIIDILSGIVQTIKGIMETITGILTGDWQKISDGILNILEGLIKAIANIFSSIVNVIIGALNGLIRAANKIKIPGTDVGVNIEEIPRWSPKLADGGIVYRETNFGNFIAGEAGAEAIVPLENSEYTKVLAREIVNGIVEAGIGGGDTYNIENAFGDERTMERLVGKIIDTKKRMDARKGVIAYG